MTAQRSDLKWLNSRVVATVLVTKLFILLFGFQAFEMLENKPVSSAGGFLGIWNRWDAAHYLKIAEQGYTSFGDDRFLIVFFPFYPALVALIEVVTGSYLLSAFIVSGVASVALGILFRELVRSDHSEKVAQLSVLFLFIFPTSYFLHIPYTESLFLALTIGSFLAARKRSWLIAGALGCLACATRINGLVLIPALLFEVWEEYREVRTFNTRWMFLLLIPFGFAGYLVINYFVAGDPLLFLTYQREHWYRYFRWPWEGIWETIKRLNNPTVVDAHMNGFQELLFVCIGASALLFGWKLLRPSYRVWLGLNWLLFVSTSFVLSVPRYTLTLFPVFIIMGVIAKHRWSLRLAFACWSLLYLALFTTFFVRGHWAF